MLVQWQDVSLSFPDKQVLQGVSLTVHRGDKVALVGENGTGKTCLFRILLGGLTPDGGRVIRTAGVRVGHLDQDLIDTGAAGGRRACLEAALEPCAHLVALERRLGELYAALERCREGAEFARLLDTLGEAQASFEAQGGYTYRTRVEATLQGMGLARELWPRPVASLSAGQKVRLALARLLLGEYDLLLLDEPTNHLDLVTREWLAERLAKTETTYVVASHDRRFLDRVSTKVAHLDRGTLNLYPGNYTAFREQVEQATAAAWRLYEKRRKLVRKLEEQARSYRDWSHAKEKQKIGAGDKGFVGRRAAKLMQRSLTAQRRLEATITAMKVEKPFEKDRIAMDFHAREGHRLLQTEELAVGFDRRRPLARELSIHVAVGDRLAVLGPNGCGKTTLLRTLLGELPPLAGRVRCNPSARVGYFDQENRRVPLDTVSLDAVLETGKDETLARTVMGRLRIHGDSVKKPLGALSAGERTKVLLARLILGDHNLLILDEPTNHLDIETQDVLLDALQGFPGGILFVSHDRHVLETLSTGVLSLDGDVEPVGAG